MKDKKLTTTQVAALFDVDTRTIQRWADAGKLPYSKTLGGHRRFDRARVERVLERVEGD